MENETEPPSSPEAVDAEEIREIPKSERNRVFWGPGQPHPLDVIPAHVEALNAQIPQEVQPFIEQAMTLQRYVASLQTGDMLASLEAADGHANATLFHRFGVRKHLMHFQVYFAWIRRKRVLALLRVITAALTLVNQLLQELFPLLQAPDTPLPTAADPPPLLSKEERRLQGVDGPPITVVPDLKESRRLLARFQKQFPELRGPLSIGRGWLEVRYIPKYSRKLCLINYLEALETWRTSHIPMPEQIAQALPPEAREILAQGKEVEDLLKLPKALRLQIFDLIWRGPYVRFRWEKDGVNYMISLAGPEDYPPYPFTPEGE